jgi:hypothetical protein
LTFLAWIWSHQYSVPLTSCMNLESLAFCRLALLHEFGVTGVLFPWPLWHEFEGITTLDSWFSIVTTIQPNDVACCTVTEADGKESENFIDGYNLKRDTVMLLTIWKRENLIRNCIWIKWVYPCCSKSSSTDFHWRSFRPGSPNEHPDLNLIFPSVCSNTQWELLFSVASVGWKSNRSEAIATACSDLSGKEEWCHLFQQILASLTYTDVLKVYPKSKCFTGAFPWGDF